MIENQDIEFKTVWKEDYLKWVCGMANSNGGIIYIGIGDNGKVIGIDNASKLVKEIPNKIKDTMGIIPEVKVEKENDLLYIVIKVEKYPVPISYQGKFYMRSGSNNHEVNGAELDRIMLRKLGKTWDSIHVPNVTIEDLDKNAINKFKKLAVKNKRLSEKNIEIDDETLLKNLGLYDGENLTVAAILLFHENPEKWVTGSYIKIGFFENNNADLRYQDEIHGSLIMQAEQVVDLVYTKYLKALIRYEDLKRVEEYMFPKEGFREIIYNALQHKLYNTCIPIQISVYDDKIYVWNDGQLPSSITKENLFKKHASRPTNPKIAQTFFKAGFIESWGRGFEKIKDECYKYHTPVPEIVEDSGGVMIKCNPSEDYIVLLADMGKDNFKEDYTNKITKLQNNILKILKENPNITQQLLAEKLNLSRQSIASNLRELRKNNVIERVGSNKKGYWKIN